MNTRSRSLCKFMQCTRYMYSKRKLTIHITILSSVAARTGNRVAEEVALNAESDSEHVKVRGKSWLVIWR